MLYFTLPNFYHNYVIIQFFCAFFKQHRYKYIIDGDKLGFFEATGNFPYCYWNGGFNNNRGDGALWKDINGCLETLDAPLRLNCSNLFLETDDFDDTFANIILQIFENGCHSIEISNLQLMEYIKNKYPNYRFIFSKDAFLMEPATPEMINNLIDTQQFRLIEIPEQYNDDFEFLSQIKDRSKIELTLNPCCKTDCQNYYKCKLHSHTSQIEYSGINVYDQCAKCKQSQFNLTEIKSIEKLKEVYQPLGITHFKLSETYDAQQLIDFLIAYFVKVEYQQLAYEEVQKIMSKGV